MRSFYAFLFLLAALLISGSAKFTISPPNYEIFAKPGEEITFLLNIENYSDTILHVNVSPSDWDIDLEGKTVFLPPNTIDYSCSDWLYINPSEFNIEPMTRSEIRVTATVPENVFGQYRSILFFETAPYTTDFSSMIMLSGRIGCAVYISILGTISLNGEINNILLNKDKNISVFYENTGNMHQRINVKLKVLKDDKTIYENEIESKLVLPEKEIRVDIPVETFLSKGNYTAKVLIDYGGNELLEGEKTITVN